MNKLSRDQLLSLEDYAIARPRFRADILQHKKTRQLALNEHARLYFEDRQTIQYQIQEILRVEKTFEPAAIEEELEAYNPLIPDGSNLKATFMLEYPDAEIRKQKVVELRGIEHKVWLQVEGYDKVTPISNEDLSRDDGTRTSTVHFMRFEFSSAMIAALQNGAQLSAGIDHPAMSCEVKNVAPPIRESLLNDFTPVTIN